jgi:membrane fusion protein
MASFFRPEAIESQRQVWLGTVQLVRPLSLWLLTVAALCMLAAVAGFLTWGEYTRKARVAGVLVPERGVIRLLSPFAGTVLERSAVEGQVVAQGDVLFVLSLDHGTASGNTQEQVQSSLASRGRSLQEAARQQELLLASQRTALNQRLADMRREATQLVAEGDLHRQRLQLATQALRRLESLRDEQFISSAQVQAKNEEVLGLQVQAQGLAREQAQQQREVASIESQLRELPLQAQARQGEIERELSELAQRAAEAEGRRRLVIRAPQAGVLTAVLADLGQSVSPSLALVSLVPADAQMQAHLYAPSSAVGFVRAEQTVLLRYQAFPYQKFVHQSGRVLQVSRTPLQPSEISGAGGHTGEPMYRITVALEQQAVAAYGVAQPLAAGMQLEADVLLDRRRLIEWIFEPVLSVAGRV